jgi:hypothetical protein
MILKEENKTQLDKVQEFQTLLAQRQEELDVSC